MSCAVSCSGSPAFAELHVFEPDSYTAPALELQITDRTIAVAHKNLTQCEVRYYELDVEFAFTAQPFASADGTAAAFVRPNFTPRLHATHGFGVRPAA